MNTSLPEAVSRLFVDHHILLARLISYSDQLHLLRIRVRQKGSLDIVGPILAFKETRLFSGLMHWECHSIEVCPPSEAFAYVSPWNPSADILDSISRGSYSLYKLGPVGIVATGVSLEALQG